MQSFGLAPFLGAALMQRFAKPQSISRNDTKETISPWPWHLKEKKWNEELELLPLCLQFGNIRNIVADWRDSTQSDIPNNQHISKEHERDVR